MPSITDGERPPRGSVAEVMRWQTLLLPEFVFVLSQPFLGFHVAYGTNLEFPCRILYKLSKRLDAKTQDLF